MVGQVARKRLNVKATRIKLDQEGADAFYFKELYNLVKDSTVTGRILAFFDLEECDLDEDEGETTHAKPKDGLTIANVEKLNMEPTDVKITVTALCLRNLTSSAKKPILKFKLTSDPEDKEYVINVNEERVSEQETTCNPYILNTIQFETKVADNISDWPFLKISLIDDGFLGCKNGYTTLLLFPYAPFIPETDKKATICMYNTNVDINKTRSRAGTTKRGSSLGSKLSHRSLRTLSGSHRSSKKSQSALSSISSLSAIEEDDDDEKSEALESIAENPEEEKDGAREKRGQSVKGSKAGSSRAASSKHALSAKELEDQEILAADAEEETQALIDDLYNVHFQDFDHINLPKYC